MDTVDEKRIISAIHTIRKQQQRPDKISISTYLDRKYGLSKSAATRTIDYMLDSATIYCKPRNGKDSYYIFDPLNVYGYEEEATDSETDFLNNPEPHVVATTTKDDESGQLQSPSPVIQTSRKHSGELLGTTQGFLEVMDKLAGSINELNKQLMIERERNESLTAKLNVKMEEIMKLQLRVQGLEMEASSKSEKKISIQKIEDRDIVPAKTELTFRSQWDSYVSTKRQQYEQYIISKKAEEMKLNTPEGTYKRKEKIHKSKNAPDSMPKNARNQKKIENTSNRNQENDKVQKQNKFSNLALNSNDKKGAQPPSKETDDMRDTHHWRKGTTLIAGDSILYGIDEKKICRNGSVKVRVFSGTTIEDPRDYYLKPLLRKQPSKVILHVGTNNASLTNASPDRILDALLDLKKKIEDQVPGCVVILSMPTKRFDNEKLGKIIEALNKKITDLGIEAINNNNISRGDIGRKGLHLNSKGTNKLIHKFISKLRYL